MDTFDFVTRQPHQHGPTAHYTLLDNITFDQDPFIYTSSKTHYQPMSLHCFSFIFGYYNIVINMICIA
jgi:hypothetical protein